MRFKLALVAVGVFAASIAVAGLPRVAAGRPRADPADAVGRLDLHKAEVDQVRRSISLTVRTSGGFRLSALDRHPDTTNPGERFICLQIHHYGTPSRANSASGRARRAAPTPSGTRS